MFMGKILLIEEVLYKFGIPGNPSENRMLFILTGVGIFSICILLHEFTLELLLSRVCHI